MGKRAQRIPSWPGVIHSNKGRIHLRRPTCDILTFRLRRSGGPYILVDLLPCGFERLSRDRQLNGLVRVRQEHDVEFRMKSFSNSEQRQKTVVHGGEVSPQINQAVFSRSDFFVKLFWRQSAEQLVRTFYA